MLIYQVENGASNAGKTPSGGVIYQSSVASSMAISIANPITYYGSKVVINQAGHSSDLYNYYWTSYSRGVDGKEYNKSWHNAYLDGYIPLRAKSIYDPCPYLYRIPSNGTFNQFTSNAGWTEFSFLGGGGWNINTICASWFLGLGWRDQESSTFEYVARDGFYFFSTASGQNTDYGLLLINDKRNYLNWSDQPRSFGNSVRCIEEEDSPLKHPNIIDILDRSY